jgi:hypothetical protein
MRRLRRGRFFATAGEMALGFYAASGPPLAAGTQAAPSVSTIEGGDYPEPWIGARGLV